MTTKMWQCVLAGGLVLSMSSMLWADNKSPKPSAAPKPSATPTPTPTPTPAPTAFNDEFAAMVKECQFTAPQQDKLHKIQDGMDKDLKKFDDASKKKLDELQQKMTDANDPKDKARFGDQIKQIGAQRDAEIGKYRSQAYGLMTADQKVAWSTYKLTQIMTDEFRTLALTEQQAGQLKDICAAAGKKVAPDKLGDPSALKQVEDEIVKVLTDAQKSSWTDLKAKAASAKP